MSYERAKVVPFSSVVGSSVTLHDREKGHVVGQLALLNVAGGSVDEWKRNQVAMAEEVATAINAKDDLVSSLDQLVKIVRSFDSKGPFNLVESAGGYRDADDKMVKWFMSDVLAQADSALAKAVAK